FGWEPPIYIHVEHIMKNSKEKLSKRNGDASFEDLIEKGFLTEAVLNYIALLGWSPKGENEIFSLDELIKEFDISGLSKSPAIFDPVKLRAINAEYIRRLSPEKFLEYAEPYIRQSVKREDVNIRIIAETLQPRTEIFTEIPEQVDFIDALPEYSTELYRNKKMKTDEATSLIALKEVLPVMQALDDWSIDGIHAKLFELVEKLGVKNGYVLWPVRVALSGKERTPGGAIEIAAILGKEESLKRINKGIELLSK
ncbi:MAG TPA: glutamate--tRNA ligase family protein, partial [Oscillospiraceae bacterium]|nr:glutamate--tRNA ligase family protein [Oscillospiraceae bacterium]